ncbi:nuclease-related domain-containing protein [Salisediminibacterium halotolerans]|uniref:Nuclease-related domain-containing protein n=1 Tax=Salisediminibacterium halotolerans TaxID=517425 RepID=A0A1H9UY29_9BACI|nr:nuclease-related domain-containing protein [Salisediminibacterium haloalkalitolerans]SES14248.1 Nuclease-related domain-containing protein [Salisediminibacterium haloalkalitolerans]
MAQIVKLSHYVSRYEIDIYRYPSRYVRLKRERWNRLKQEWNAKQTGFPDAAVPQDGRIHRDSRLQRTVKRLFRRKTASDDIPYPDFGHVHSRSLEDVKAVFQEELFHFQIGWASSTVSEVSRVKQAYYQDEMLRRLVKNLPDTFFIFYEPVCFMKKAPVELDIVIVSPSDIWVIKPLAGDGDTIYTKSSERYWEKRGKERTETFLSPMYDLNRMRTVIEHLLEEEGISLPVYQAVVAKDSFLDVSSHSTRTKLIDKRTIDSFMQKLINNQAPIKHTQLKIADALLCNVQTVSESRIEADLETIEKRDD